MTDLSSLFKQPGSTSHRLTDSIHKLIEEAVDIFAEDGLEWEFMTMPYPTPEGVRIGCIFAMWMPTPILDDSKFYVSRDFPEPGLFQVEANVRQVVRDFVETLRANKAAFLKGNN